MTHQFENLKVALVHDWLNGMRGGEKVLENLCRVFPKATIFTLHSELDKVSPLLRSFDIQHSFIQHLPFRKKLYRWYLPLFPLAVAGFDFEGYDLVISSSHCAAKNVPVGKGSLHLCYCFSPMRYLWGLQDDYLGRGSLKRLLASPFIAPLKRWDYKGCRRVDRFVAISRTIQERIHTCYDRESDLVYPPNDIPYDPCLEKDDYFLVLSALVPYKKVDLAVRACRAMGKKLHIAGTGPEMERLKSLASEEIVFHGWVTEDKKRELLKRARALLFPGLEDFGIVPVEAMALGTPVIAYGKGGVTETVIDSRTGLFFSEQSEASLRDAMAKLDHMNFDMEDFRRAVERFSSERFRENMTACVKAFLAARDPRAH